MRNLPFSPAERWLLSALLAFLSVNSFMRFTLPPREPFSVIEPAGSVAVQAEPAAQPVLAPDEPALSRLSGGAGPAGFDEAASQAGEAKHGDAPSGDSDPDARFDLLAFLNEAPAERLTELPGIGPVLAGRIVAYREEAGPFRRVEEVTEVQGIGRARLEELRAFAGERAAQ